MNIRLNAYALGIFCVGLLTANHFAIASDQPSNDLGTTRPATLPNEQPDGTIPPTLHPALPAQDPANLLALARNANDDVYANLQSFVCDEQMRRFKSKIDGENTQPIDIVTTKVSFENGIEHYSDIRQVETGSRSRHLSSVRIRPSIASIAGAWSTGECGTLLHQTEDLLKTQTTLFRRYTDLDGVPAAVFGVEISAQDSPWDLDVRFEHYHIPFRTEVWVSRASGQILKIERVSTGIPASTGISEIRWGVTLQPVEMSGKTWLLPQTGDYAVLYEGTQRRESNQMTFSNYHRYGSEVALRFQ